MHVGWMSKVFCMFVPFIWNSYAALHLYTIRFDRRCASACVLMNVRPLGHNLSTYQILLKRSKKTSMCYHFNVLLSLAIHACVRMLI